jgi:conjugal transfer pilus assembly protein TraF
MIFKYLSALMFCFVVSISTAAAKEPPGWLWYNAVQQKKEDKKAPVKKEAPVPVVSSSSQKSSAEHKIEKVQRAFDQAKAEAIIHPTFENVQKVQTLQREMLNQSENFGNMWMLVSLSDAANHPVSDNTNVLHREIYEREEKNKLGRQLRELSKNFGLFFIFKEDCPYCHRYAPIVKKFADAYGFEVKAISSNGGKIAEFSNSVADNGAISKLNPEGIYPALLLANPQTGEVAPLSWGMISLSALHKNAQTILGGGRG